MLCGSMSVLLPFPAAGKPIAVPVHLEDMNMVGQPVEQSAGETLGTEHRCPFVERQVAGDERAAALVALAEHLEQQFAANGGERDIAQFIQDQQLYAGEMLLQLA